MLPCAASIASRSNDATNLKSDSCKVDVTTPGDGVPRSRAPSLPAPPGPIRSEICRSVSWTRNRRPQRGRDSREFAEDVSGHRRGERGTRSRGNGTGTTTATRTMSAIVVTSTRNDAETRVRSASLVSNANDKEKDRERERFKKKRKKRKKRKSLFSRPTVDGRTWRRRKIDYMLKSKRCAI